MSARVFVYDAERRACVVQETHAATPPEATPPIFQSSLNTGPRWSNVLVFIGIACPLVLILLLGWLSPIYLMTAGALTALTAVTKIILRRHSDLCCVSGDTVRDRFALLQAAIKSLNARTTIKDAVLRHLLDVLVPLTLIGVIYSVAQVWLTHGLFRNETSRTLLWMEQTSIWLRTQYPLTKFILKVPKKYELGFVVLFCVLGVFVPAIATLQLVARWKKAARWLGRAYVTLTILSSITFFGHMQTGTVEATVARLNQDSKKIRQSYGDIQEQANQIVARMAVEQMGAQHFAPAFADLDRLDESVKRAQATAAPARRQGVRVDLSAERIRDSVSGTSPQDVAPRQSLRRTTGTEAQQAQQRTATEVSPNFQWSSAEAEGIKTKAQEYAARAKFAPEQYRPAVDAASEYVYDQVFAKGIDAAMASAGLESELLHLVTDPFLKSPVKELLVRKSRELFDRLANKREPIAVAAAAVQAEMSEEITRFDPPEWKSQTADLETRIQAATRKANQFEAEAPGEVERAVNSTYDRKLAEFDRSMIQLFGENPDPTLRAALHHLTSEFHAQFQRQPNAMDKLSALSAVDRSIARLGTNLETLSAAEKGMLGTTIIADAVTRRVPTILAADRYSKWGQIREDMCVRVMSDNNRMDALGRRAAKASISEWLAARKDIAKRIAFQYPGSSTAAIANIWESEFFGYMQAHPDLAGLWGFMVIAVEYVPPRLTYHTIPEDGFIYYGQSTGLANQQQVRELFSQRATILMIDAVCRSKPDSGERAQSDFLDLTGRSGINRNSSSRDSMQGLTRRQTEMEREVK